MWIYAQDQLQNQHCIAKAEETAIASHGEPQSSSPKDKPEDRLSYRLRGESPNAAGRAKEQAAGGESTKASEKAVFKLASNNALHLRVRTQGRFSALFAAIYALGLLAGGALYTLCGTAEAGYLNAYVSSAAAPFEQAQPMALFVRLCVAAFVPATLILIVSLCVFGAPLLVLLVLLKGAGIGVLVEGLVRADGQTGLVFYALVMALADACCAAALCVLAGCGVRVAGGLFRQLFGGAPQVGAGPDKPIRRPGIPQAAGALIRCYLMAVLVLAILNGVIAASAGLFAGRLPW